MENINNRLTWKELLMWLVDDKFILNKKNMISYDQLPIVPDEYIDDGFENGIVMLQTNKDQTAYNLIALYHATTFCLCKVWSLYDENEPVGLKEAEYWCWGIFLNPDIKTRLELQRMTDNLIFILQEIEILILDGLFEGECHKEIMMQINEPTLFFTKDLDIVICES